MISKALDRPILLIPGWASDHRIFTHLKSASQRFLAVDLSSFNFEEELIDFLDREKISKISLFGWSMGGFLAAQFAGRHPDIVERLILVSVRCRYKKNEIDQVKALLERSKKGYLYKFYHSCFFKEEDMCWFKENLLNDYCESFELADLLKGLDYLSVARIDTESLKAIPKIEFIHGESDNISPIQEALRLQGKLPNATFAIVKGAGHMPFLNQTFTELI